MNNTIKSLAKTSSENEIKTYFQNVLALHQSGEEFPVNLDEIWMAVYARREDAIEPLSE